MVRNEAVRYFLFLGVFGCSFKIATATQDTEEKKTYRGQCFKDYSEKRMLSYRAYRDNLQNSICNCTQACALKNYTYAGVQFGHQCFCGNHVDPAQGVADDECNMDCTGSDAKCGGHLRVNVYDIGTIVMSWWTPFKACDVPCGEGLTRRFQITVCDVDSPTGWVASTDTRECSALCGANLVNQSVPQPVIPAQRHVAVEAGGAAPFFGTLAFFVMIGFCVTIVIFDLATLATQWKLLKRNVGHLWRRSPASKVFKRRGICKGRTIRVKEFDEPSTSQRSKQEPSVV